MSSGPARVAITAAVEAAAAPLSLPVLDISDFVSLEDALPANDSAAILIQFATADERVVAIGGENDRHWEEDGTVVLHLVVNSGFDSAMQLIQGEAIRVALRGTRHDDVTIESCSPFSDFSAGASGLYGGTWKGWAANLYYVRRDCG